MFELIAVANKWENGRYSPPCYVANLLTYTLRSCTTEEKADTDTMKKALADRAGLTKDPLAAARKFDERRQESNESVRDFELSLRKLFMEAYPKDCADTSSVFLGRFVSGLVPEIAKQVLLNRDNDHDDLNQAVRSALRVERVLGFHRSDGLQVQALQTGTQDNLREMLEKVINRIDALESRLEEKHVTSSAQKFRQDIKGVATTAKKKATFKGTVHQQLGVVKVGTHNGMKKR